MRNIRKQVVVPQTARQMYDLVDRAEDYPNFLPWCSNTIIQHRTPDEVQATITINAAGFEKSFTTCNRLQVGKMIEIRLVDGPFKHLEGFWLFEDLENGSRVLLELDFEFAGGLLNFAFDPVFHHVATTLVDAFVTQAKTQYATAAL